MGNEWSGSIVIYSHDRPIVFPIKTPPSFMGISRSDTVDSGEAGKPLHPSRFAQQLTPDLQFLAVPSGNQTWLAGKCPTNEGSNRKIIHKYP